jgi:hypothetical protein
MIQLSNHAITRFHERVKPALSRGAAADELRELIKQGRLVEDDPRGPLPEDMPEDDQAMLRDADGWLIVSEGVWLPLIWAGKTLMATTCIVPGISKKRRRKRTIARRTKKNSRRTREQIFLGGKRRTRHVRWQ